METHLARFIDGPAAGRTATLTGGLESLPESLEFPVFPNGVEDDGDDPIASATYHRTGLEFRLVRLDQSQDVLATAKRQIAETRARMAAKAFYDRPNYSAYTIPHGSIHTQAFVEHGHRKGHVDERLAPLIQQVWRLNLDTLASCQDRTQGAQSPGTAYVRFFVRSDAKRFDAMLKAASFQASYADAEMTIGNQNGK
jgi:hypothetical protein